jgi:hypothetical protein
VAFSQHSRKVSEIVALNDRSNLKTTGFLHNARRARRVHENSILKPGARVVFLLKWISVRASRKLRSSIKTVHLRLSLMGLAIKSDAHFNRAIYYFARVLVCMSLASG